MGSGNILVSSVGRRVGLVACLRDSIAARRPQAKVFGVDCSGTAPAAFMVDGAERVPRCTDQGFVDAIGDFCASHEVELIVPTIDTELPVYAAAWNLFAAAGVNVCISSPATVRICCDKIETNRWLVANGFPTVRQTGIADALADPNAWPFPLIAKPFNGSASVGVRRVQTRIELESLAAANGAYIVQELGRGREFTINVYVDRSGQCVCAVPHWRVEIRSGEVSKGLTVKDGRLIDLARRVGQALPGAYGALNIQCFMDDSGAIKIIEMNARFGGGYPLAHRAGARFTDWLLDEMAGTRIPYFEGWESDLAMLRYDEAVFVSGDKIRTCSEPYALSSTLTTRCI
jgi:carbamoyl-phosphate synthase large subunit